jgi:serine protease Do
MSIMNFRLHVAAVAAVLSIAICGAPTQSFAQDVPRTNATVKAVRKAKPSVVAIKVPASSSASKSIGTGVVIDERGYIVTNRHVVAGAEQIIVRFVDGTELFAKIIVSDGNTDLAILKVNADKKLPALALAPCNDVEVGEDVIAIGHPYGYSFTVSKGIVSALERKIELPNGVALTGMIQTSAQINPGNSGGPLLNINGEFIGVVTALRDGAQGIAFAINSDTIKRVLLEKLPALKVAGVSHGLKVQEKVIAATGDRQQVIVAGMPDASAAAGLQNGDVIRYVGNLTVKNSFDIERALYDAKPGQQVAVRVVRQGAEVTVTLTLSPAGGPAVVSAGRE